MNNGKHNFDELFNHFNGQWDTEEPAQGHQDRFLDRLERNKKKKKLSVYKMLMPVAAAVLILLGVFTTLKQGDPETQPVAKVSPQVKETQMYFASIIERELEKIEKENSPETKQLVRDAIEQVKKLEKDYEKLTNELITKGENKQIIHAMITNLETRISFLQDVMTRIENIKKLKESYNENNNA